ncbi:MAG: homoserine O-acetyltransferase [Pseudomonadota bacterium]
MSAAEPLSLDAVQRLTLPEPLQLDCGETLEGVEIAFETYGEANADKSNVILACHALTGDQYAGGVNKVTGRPAWWPRLIGPGLPLDTSRFQIIATNVLGGCMGSTGPASQAPDGLPYATRFPVITIGDMVRAQRAFVDAMGIEKLFNVIGGSMGGMQALEWCVQAPERVVSAIPIATAARHSAQNIAFYQVGRQAVMADPNWRNGNYIAEGVRPDRGLAVARMAAHITYVSEAGLKRRFDRGLQDRDETSFSFDTDFQVESYMRHQGASFVERFDANAYLYITRAMDYFDLAAAHGGRLSDAFTGAATRFCLFSFSSDWHYPPEESRVITKALAAAGAEVSHIEIESDKGHDAFFLEEPAFEAALAGFLNATAEAAGL